MQRESGASKMACVSHEQPSRRDFVKWSGGLTAGTALAGLSLPHVHAAEDNTIRLALICCREGSERLLRDVP